MQQGDQNTAAGSAYGVTQRNGAAVDVQLLHIKAEVIEINNVRVVTSTYISGTAGSLVCDGTKLKSPFTIRAIGDSDNLQNAVNLAGGVGSRLKVKYGATVSVSPSDKVMIKSTRQAPQYTYAHVIGQ